MKKTLIFLMLSFPVFSQGQGIITTFAGNGTASYSGDGGMATAAAINNPVGIVFDTAGNAYISDRLNNRIRVVSPSGIINTFAGNGTAGYSGDGGSALSAEFTTPNNLAIDRQGNIYIADYGNDVIRKVSTSGIITTVAGVGGIPGYGGDGGPATNAYLFRPSAIAVDTFGNIYIADYNNSRIREVATTGIISTIAGNGTPGSSGDGGPATSALLNGPFGVCLDDTGNIYIGDAANNKVRKISVATGIITTFAGTGTPGFSGDGGPANVAELNNPPGVAADHFGNIFIADQFNYRIREVTPDGNITTIVGNGTQGYSGDGGPGLLAEINDANALTIGPAETVVICDNSNNRVRQFSDCVNAITLNPVSDTVTVGDTAIFTVATSAVSVVYQWQENPGTGFVNLANVLPYSGVNTNTLTIVNPSVLLDTTQYRCVVSTSSSLCPDTSSSAILIIESGTGITQVLSSASVNIFPNPAHNDITIQLSAGVNNGNIQLLNELGQVVSAKNITGNTVNFDLSELPAAVYLLKISTNGSVLYSKVIKN